MLRSSSQVFAVDNFARGLDWTTTPAKVGPGWMVDAKNFNLNAFGAVEKRNGCVLLYPSAISSNPVMSLYEYRAASGTNYLLAVAGDELGFYDSSNAEWHVIKSGLTSTGSSPILGLRCSFATHNGFCYIVNGTDENFKIQDSVEWPIVGITRPPSMPTTAVTGIVGPTGTYKWVYAYVRSGNPTELISNYSEVSGSVTLATQGCTVGGVVSNDPQVDKVFIYRTLNLGDGISDSTQFFKCGEVANGASGSITLAMAFTGAGLNDLSSQADPTNFAVNLMIRVHSDADSGFTIDFVGKSSALNDVHDCANSVDSSVDFWIRVANSTVNPNHFQTSSDGKTWTAAHDMAKTGNTKGNTTWHFGAVTGHTKGNTWHITKKPDTYEVSEDDGGTWGPVTDFALTNTWKTTTWAWAAIVGHTANNYWTIKTTSANAWSFLDTLDDNSLTVLAKNDHTPPPRATFVCLHKDRMFYANCPGEEYGHSLFMFSSSGEPESVPSTNYHYFDKQDGNPITGIASVPDYLIVFKKNKIAVMEGDFEQWYTISNGIGCIAPWGLTVVGDKVFFLSEEGFKATDGRTVYDVGKKMKALNRAGYFSLAAAADFTSAYYPEKQQVHFNLYHATYNNLDIVGHLLTSLYQDAGEELTGRYNAADTAQYIGYTYHEYDSHVFRTIGTYTDANGISRLVAGTNTGSVYLLDSGSIDGATDGDAGHNIVVNLETGWYPLGIPDSLTKLIRGITVTYASNATTGYGTPRLYYDVDFVRNSNYVVLTKGGSADTTYPLGSSLYTGPDLVTTENLDVEDSTVGRMFRFRLTDTSAKRIAIMSIVPYFRVEGRR